MATTWRKIIVSGSVAELAQLSVDGKLSISGSLYAELTENNEGGKKVVIFDEATKQLFFTSSAAGGGGGIFISKDGGNYYTTDNTLVVSGSTLKVSPTENPLQQLPASNANSKYAFIVSESAYFANHNVGHPNSLAWQSNLDNTIFNSYDANTDVSQILRTIVGVISASNGALVASPQPNATSWINSTISYTGTGGSSTATTWTTAYVPVTSNETTFPRVAPIRYLLSKGFATEGAKVFNGISTVYQTTSHTYRPSITSNPTDYFDAGNAGEGATFITKLTQSFSDNSSVTAPTALTATYTTQSYVFITSTSDTAPLYVTDIETGTPTVIPAQYQEAKYESITPLSARKWTDGTSYSGTSVSSNVNAISSSGYYRWHDGIAGFASKSNANETELIGGFDSFAATTRFMTPLTTADIISLEPQSTAGYSDTPLGVGFPQSAESRSLSGAPYLNGARWINVNDIRLPGIFKPLYYSTTGTTTVTQLITSDNVNFPISSSFGGYNGNAGRAVIVSNGQLVAGSYVTSNNGSEISQGSLPLTPNVEYTASIGTFDVYAIGTEAASYTFDVDYTNAVEGYPADNTTYFTLLAQYRKWNDGAWQTSYSKNVPFHDTSIAAFRFGQPESSGSLLVWMYNGASLAGDGETNTSTRFREESRRKQIRGNTIAQAIASTWDSDERLALGDNGDLQQKPGVTNGYLVNPEHGQLSSNANTSGGYGYWYPTGSYNRTHEKWYMQEIDLGLTTGQSYGNLVFTITGDSSFSDLIPWTTTTVNKHSIGIIFSYQLAQGGTPIIYDLDSTGTTPILTGESADTANNPFNESINVQAQWTSRVQGSSTITVGLRAAADQQIYNDGSNNYSKIYVLVRYRGAPSNTLRGIQVSGS